MNNIIKGTEKQIAWATKIVESWKKEFLTGLESPKICNYINVSKENFFKFIESYDDASFIISYRNDFYKIMNAYMKEYKVKNYEDLRNDIITDLNYIPSIINYIKNNTLSSKLMYKINEDIEKEVENMFWIDCKIIFNSMDIDSERILNNNKATENDEKRVATLIRKINQASRDKEVEKLISEKTIEKLKEGKDSSRFNRLCEEYTFFNKELFLEKIRNNKTKESKEEIKIIEVSFQIETRKETIQRIKDFKKMLKTTKIFTKSEIESFVSFLQNTNYKTVQKEITNLRRLTK